MTKKRGSATKKLLRASAVTEKPPARAAGERVNGNAGCCDRDAGPRGPRMEKATRGDREAARHSQQLTQAEKRLVGSPGESAGQKMETRCRDQRSH
ncbi:hypothetical protein AAY473_001760 [Plecturocebus cupreus]